MTTLREYADLYSGAELEWAERAARFVAANVEPITAEIDRGGRCRDLLRDLGAAGLLGSIIPPQFGGQGLSLVQAVLIAEEIGASSPSLAALRSVSDIFVGIPLLSFADDQQKARWLPPMCRGEQCYSLGLTEPSAGSDGAGIRTRAVRDADGYRIDGLKHYISGAEENDAVFLYAASAPEADPSERFSAFLVPLDALGVVVEPIETTGLRGLTHARVSFDDVHVAPDRLVGREGQGLQIMMAGLVPERIDIAARAVACARRALSEATSYARDRHQFGRPIRRFQAVSHKVADMRTTVDAARLLVLRAARLCDGERPAEQAAAEAKLFAAERGFGVCDAAMQVFGARGYTSGTAVDVMFRDVRALRFGGGTDEIMRHIVQREQFAQADAG